MVISRSLDVVCLVPVDKIGTVLAKEKNIWFLGGTIIVLRLQSMNGIHIHFAFTLGLDLAPVSAVKKVLDQKVSGF